MKEVFMKMIDNGLLEGLFGLFGVVVGWFLSWMTQKGRLRLFANNGLNAKFLNEDDILVDTKEEAKCFSYDISLDVYNGSNFTKIMREIQVSFENKNGVVKKSVPYDNAKTVYGNVISYSEVGVVNIPPKSVIHLDLRNYFWNKDMDFIWDVTVVKLLYKNSRGRCKSKKIEQLDYKKFDFTKQEQNNG